MHLAPSYIIWSIRRGAHVRWREKEDCFRLEWKQILSRLRFLNNGKRQIDLRLTLGHFLITFESRSAKWDISFNQYKASHFSARWQSRTKSFLYCHQQQKVFRIHGKLKKKSWNWDVQNVNKDVRMLYEINGLVTKDSDKLEQRDLLWLRLGSAWRVSPTCR